MRACSPALHRMAPFQFIVLAAVFAALFSVARPAFASSNDRVSFGQRIVVGENETADDLVCFLCSIDIKGTVDGDVVSFLGGVKSKGPIHGDVVSFLGDVDLADAGSIDGSLVVMGGNLHKGAESRVGSDRVVFPVTIVLLPFLFLAALLWAIVRLFRRRPVYFVPSR
jgi:hypothetical protein